MARKSRRGGPTWRPRAPERRRGRAPAPQARANTIASESVYSSSGYAAVSTNTTGVCRSTTHTCDHETHKGTSGNARSNIFCCALARSSSLVRLRQCSTAPALVLACVTVNSSMLRWLSLRFRFLFLSSFSFLGLLLPYCGSMCLSLLFFCVLRLRAPLPSSASFCFHKDYTKAETPEQIESQLSRSRAS